MGHWLRVVALGWFCVTASGCGCGDDDDASDRVEGRIGPNGGDLTSADERVTLWIPPTALDEELTFFIQSSSATAPDGTLGIPYDIGADGREVVDLNEPASIEIRYDDDQLAGRPPQALHAATAGASGIDWICISYSAVEDNTLVIATSHLSTWAARFIECSDDSGCTLPEKCLGTVPHGYCAIPCLNDTQCPFPMSCTPDGICARTKCFDGGPACPADTTCSGDIGVCLPTCTPGGACGEPGGAANAQQICTPEAHCVFDRGCPADVDCASDPDLPDTCLHGWCVENTWGCDCGDDGCPCLSEAGEADLSGSWFSRYNCARIDDEQCVDPDGCSETVLSAGADATEWVADGFVGNLDGYDLTWEAHWDDGDGPYTEVGVWTFAVDWRSFTQESCYAYDDEGTADLGTMTCTGASAGRCTAFGARVAPGPPAGIGQCPEGPADGSCP